MRQVSISQSSFLYVFIFILVCISFLSTNSRGPNNRTHSHNGTSKRPTEEYLLFRQGNLKKIYIYHNTHIHFNALRLFLYKLVFCLFP